MIETNIADRSLPDQVQTEKARDVICGILALSGGRVQGKLRLFKTFYHAHLFYWNENPGTLTNYPIIRASHGPEIDRASDLLAELQSQGRIRLLKEPVGPYTEYVYELSQPFTLDLSTPEHRAIEAAVKHVNGKTPAELVEETYERSRSWNEAEDGQELNIYVDVLDDDDFCQMERNLQETEEALNRVFCR